MRLVFLDKLDWQCDIVCRLLESWNVRYKIITCRQRGFGSTTQYNIEVDVEYEFFEFLKREVEKAEEAFANLELSFKAPCADKEQDKKTAKGKKRGRPKKTNALQDFLQKESKIAKLFEAINESIKEEQQQEDEYQISFDELEDFEQELLTSQMPEHMLKSNACQIIRTPFGLKILYKGE
jgi:hypothetical protein